MDIKEVVANIGKRNMNAYLVSNREEAKKKVLSLLDEFNLPVSAGGSATMKEIGVMDALKDYDFIDRGLIKDNDYMKHWVMKNCYSSGVFLSGTNAITEDGCLVNMDGWGNRVNAINYGPDKVIIVVGKNKIVKTLDEARKRIADIAGPPNTKRLKYDTPCAKDGKCHDCRAAERICNVLSVIEFQRDKDRMHVILVDEELGY